MTDYKILYTYTSLICDYYNYKNNYSDLNSITHDVDIYYKVCDIGGQSAGVAQYSASNCLIGIIVPAIYIVFCVGIAVFSVLKYQV